MKKEIKSVEDAFEIEGLDPKKIVITGVPERHVEALKALAKIFVVHDHVNPEYTPDYTIPERKFEAIHYMGSPSGGGFSFYDFGYWLTSSFVGSRLVSESAEKARHIARICHEEYKAFKVYDRSKLMK